MSFSFTTSKLLGAILGVMTLTFVTLSLVGGGPLDSFLNLLSNEIKEETRSAASAPVKIDSKEELAGIAKLAMDRAAECDTVQAHTYPDLKNTRLGSDPNCRLGIVGEGAVRDYTGPINPLGPGDDVEGEDSRIRFKITEDMKIRSDKNIGKALPGGQNIWYSGQASFGLTGVSKTRYAETITTSCNNVLGGYRTSRFSGTKSGLGHYGYILTFSTDPGRRYVTSGDHREITNHPRYDAFEGVFCPGLQSGVELSAAQELHASSRSGSGYTEVKLCKGDKGYVQVNKKTPGNNAETEDTGENLGGTPLFGYIQITESTGTCRIDDPIEPYEKNADDPRYSGNLFMVELNVDDWPGPSSRKEYRPLDILNNKKVQDFGHRRTQKMNSVVPPKRKKKIPDNKCAIGLTERGPSFGAQTETRYTLVQEGVIIDSENGLPEESSWSFPNNWQERTLLAPGVQRLEENSGSKAWQLYERLKNEGFDGSSVGTGSLSNPGEASGDLILERESRHYLELYGPVLCGYKIQQNKQNTQNNRAGSAKWHLCLPNDASQQSQTQGKTVVDGNGIKRECINGNWVRQGGD